MSLQKNITIYSHGPFFVDLAFRIFSPFLCKILTALPHGRYVSIHLLCSISLLSILYSLYH